MIDNRYLTKIRFREDTAINWANANPILASSEPGRELDTGLLKIGDGKTNWKDLKYMNPTIDAVTDVYSDGKYYLRTKAEGAVNGEWVSLDQFNTKSIFDLYKAPYNEEMIMDHKFLCTDGTLRTLYGIKRQFMVTIGAESEMVNQAAYDASSIVQYGGIYFDGKSMVAIPHKNIELRINDENILMVDSISEFSRENAEIDIWILYTKKTA